MFSARAQASALLTALLLGLTSVTGTHAAERAAMPPKGHTRELAVVRVITRPVIDGVLEDAVWADAPVASEFWISEYGRRPSERTEVRVVIDDAAIYLSFQCYDSEPGGIRANEKQRDGSMGVDDHVIVEIDPYHNHRLVSSFMVSARGTQADRMAGGRAKKIAWKGDWQAAATRTPEGWSAEIAIPFGILDFDPASTVFGVNFVRYQSRTKEWSRWADVTPRLLREEAGHLVDLRLPGLPAATRVMVMPYASGGVNSLNRHGDPRTLTGTGGVDVRLDVARNATGVLTVHPDFRQVDPVVLGVGFDYNEKFRPDARPFFQEGAGYFGSRTYFHSGRIPDFVAGGKSYGRAGGYQFGVMAISADRGRSDYVGSLKRELGTTASAGVTFVSSNRRDLQNQLFAVHSGGRLGRVLAFAVDLANTSTTGRDGNGTHAAASLGYEGPYLQAGMKADRTEDGFLPANGFIAADVKGTQGAAVYVNYGRAFAEGLIRRVDAHGSVTARQTADALLQRRAVSLGGNAELRRNIQINATLSEGPYRPRVAGGGWLVTMNDDHFYSVSASHYSPGARFGYGMSYSRGLLGGSLYEDVAPNIWIKPTLQTAVDYSYERATSFDVAEQHILSLAWHPSSEQTLGLRFVEYGQPFYRVTYQRVVRKGVDVFAVFDREPGRPDQLVTKLVWTMNVM